MALFDRRYERTCNKCGYSWQLNRRQVKFRPRRPKVTRGRMGRVVGAPTSFQRDITLQAALAASFTHCAVCGLANYTQRPVPKNEPPK